MLRDKKVGLIREINKELDKFRQLDVSSNNNKQQTTTYTIKSEEEPEK